jgi:hypothetical protein
MTDAQIDALIDLISAIARYEFENARDPEWAGAALQDARIEETRFRAAMKEPTS